MNEPTPIADRLVALRAALRERGVDCLVVRGTDRYLNEYVPESESTRVWITGFTGSTGDALVSLDGAWLFVDGRYHVQADREVDTACFTVVKNTLGTTNEKACTDQITELAKGLPADRELVVGYEPDRFALSTFEAFSKRLQGVPARFVALDPSPIEGLRGALPPPPEKSAVRVVDEAAMGRTVREKITLVNEWMRARRLDALWVSKLDELAWLTNLRASEMPYQMTFRAQGLVTDGALRVSVHASSVGDDVRAARPDVGFVGDDDLAAAVRALAATKRARVAVDPASVNVATRDRLRALGCEVFELESPVVAAKAKKTPAEMAAMQRAFGRADQVVADAQRWLNARVAEGERVTEVDFAQQVERLFLDAGAVGLSFKVISAFGTNGAVVHHPPSADAVIRAGELMLLDTGCYFVEGFATDLTRTFFVGAPDARPTRDQQRLYTLTLKSAIAGMTARIPKGAAGAQLDGITRRPLWAEGLDYQHGTGHGVGINVHEAPPGVSKMSTQPVEEGHVFSIEPGLYLEGIGGVRIENLCTVRPDPEKEGFLRVEPLTFSPLDARLIDDALLDPTEREFVAAYRARWN